MYTTRQIVFVVFSLSIDIIAISNLQRVYSTTLKLNARLPLIALEIPDIFYTSVVYLAWSCVVAGGTYPFCAAHHLQPANGGGCKSRLPCMSPDTL